MDPRTLEELPGVIGVTVVGGSVLVSVRASYEVDEDTGEIVGYDRATRELDRMVAGALPGWSIEKHTSRKDARPQTEVWSCSQPPNP